MFIFCYHMKMNLNQYLLYFNRNLEIWSLYFQIEY